MGSKGQVDNAKEMFKLLECYPSLDALKDIEYIRDSGVVNMFDSQAVLYYLNEIGGYHGMAWIMKCKDNGKTAPWVFEHWHEAMVKEYGPIRDVLSDQDRLYYKKYKRNKRRRELEAELAQLNDEDLEA